MDHDSQAGPKSAADLAFGRLKDLLHLEFETHDRGLGRSLLHARFVATLSGFAFGALWNCALANGRARFLPRKRRFSL